MGPIQSLAAAVSFTDNFSQWTKLHLHFTSLQLPKISTLLESCKGADLFWLPQINIVGVMFFSITKQQNNNNKKSVITQSAAFSSVRPE